MTAVKVVNLSVIFLLLTFELITNLSFYKILDNIMNAMDIQMVESKLSDVTVTAIPMLNRSNSIQSQQSYQQQQQHQQQQLQHLQQQHLQQQQQQNLSSVITTQTSANITTPMTSTNNIPSSVSSGLSKYAQLLAVIEEMSRDIRPTYTGSRSSAERLKRGIVHARILVRECLLETERSARQ